MINKYIIYISKNNLITRNKYSQLSYYEINRKNILNDSDLYGETKNYDYKPINVLYLHFY